jgi:hypothetical protein
MTPYILATTRQTEWMERWVTERTYLMENNLKFLQTSFLLQEIAFDALKFKSLVNTLLCLQSIHYLFEMKVEFFSPAGNESDFP